MVLEVIEFLEGYIYSAIEIMGNIYPWLWDNLEYSLYFCAPSISVLIISIMYLRKFIKSKESKVFSWKWVAIIVSSPILLYFLGFAILSTLGCLYVYLWVISEFYLWLLSAF